VEEGGVCRFLQLKSIIKAVEVLQIANGQKKVGNRDDAPEKKVVFMLKGSIQGNQGRKPWNLRVDKKTAILLGEFGLRP